jgi:hypothetical protein
MPSDEREHGVRNPSSTPDPGDRFFERLSGIAERDAGDTAPSRLKSRVYSGLMARMAESGPIQSVHETRPTYGLCVFEDLVQITPLTEGIGTSNFCRVCHARILAERFENAPIYWGNCPYVRFQNR